MNEQFVKKISKRCPRPFINEFKQFLSFSLTFLLLITTNKSKKRIICSTCLK